MSAAATRYVIEADGGARGNPGPAAYGAVIRLADGGAVVAEVADYVGETTNNVAEYSGLIAGLSKLRELDPTGSAVVRLDSKLIVEQMTGRWKIKKAALQQLALRARDLLPVAGVTFEWVPRERNKAADALVNEVLDAHANGRVASVDRSPATGRSPRVGESPRPDNATSLRHPDLGEPTVLLAVRHGVTAATIAKKFSGSAGPDPVLAPAGVVQASAVAAEVARRGADVVLSSPLLRAQQTAAAIAEVLGVDVVVRPGLTESNFGEWDGLTYADVMAGWPDLMGRWVADPDFAPPGGESATTVYARVSGAVEEIVHQYQRQRVVIVAHVGVIRAVVGHALGLDAANLPRLELAPASLTTVRWYADSNAALRTFGETTHLDGVH